MVASFLRAAIVAIDEAGDPTAGRGELLQALTAGAAPLCDASRPASRTRRVAWAISQLAMHAADPKRAYDRLRELVAALYEPLATLPRQRPPAPEVAMALDPVALLDAIARPPRVLARELASTRSGIDTRQLLREPDFVHRVLGVRALPRAALAKHVAELASVIAGDPEPIVRAEARTIAGAANQKVRTALAAALAPYTTHASADARAAAVDALHAVKVPLPPDRLAALLADPAAGVRAAAARSIVRDHSPAADAALIACLGDDDAAVRGAALAAVARDPALHGPRIVEPLRALVERHDHDTRAAIYLLGKLRAPAAAMIASALSDAENPHQAGEAHVAIARDAAGFTPTAGIDATLAACVLGPRSDVARAAAIVLLEVGGVVPEMPVEDRLARAARELASPDHDTWSSGVLEAKRLGAAAVSLAPAIHAIGERLAVDDGLDTRAALAMVREALAALGVAAGDLPHVPSRLEAWCGITPREVTTHGAYAIASIAGSYHHGGVSVPTTSLGVWDNSTGKYLFVVDGAEVLAFVPDRAEVAVVRTAIRADAKFGGPPSSRGTSRADHAWFFERYAVPSGERIASLAIPEPFTGGWPSDLAIAADLVTVWCGDEDAPYRFHVKLGDPDRLLDDAPTAGRRTRKRG